ncbi:MAG: hypothetical protein Q9M30_03585 [Mariprofundaceae bacterium]|nr:hypothetical protein [Mariprofundaceae bacterium]
MRQRARRFLAALLLLGLATFIVVFVRLDADVLAKRIIADIENASGMHVQAGKPRLSLQHGVSLKLPVFHLAGPDADWRLVADIVRFDFSLWSLLSGDLSTSAIDLVHPVLNLAHPMKPTALFDASFTHKLLKHADRISFRQARVLVDESLILDEVAATLRRIERERQISWELQGRYAGGDVSSQGFVRSDVAGQEVSGRISAGRLVMTQLDVLPLPALHYDLLDASLTFSLDHGGHWQWFGNFLAHDNHDELPDLSWRGKLRGQSPEDFHIYDAFMRFGDKTRLTLLGGCEKGLPCELEINTQGANPAMLLKSVSLDLPLRGKLDAKISLKQEQKAWRVDGKLGLRDMHWSEDKLPDVVIALEDLRVRSMQDFRLSRAEIHPEGDKGSLEVLHLKRDGKKFSVLASLRDLKAGWVPLGNVLLKAANVRQLQFAGEGDSAGESDEPLLLVGDGGLDGKLAWHSDASASRAAFSFNANHALLGLGKAFHKPLGVRGEIKGDYEKYGGIKKLRIEDMRLGESRLHSMNLMMEHEQPSLILDLNLDLDISALQSLGVVLPPPVAAFQGRIGAAFEGVKFDVHQDAAQWLAASDGELHLRQFGREGELLSGNVHLHKGHVQATGMHWQRGPDFTDFDADLSDMKAGKVAGRIQISGASWQWAPAERLPGWLAGASLTGHFTKTDLAWSGNTWKGLRGEFAVSEGGLTLNKVTGKLAAGVVRSRRMHISPLPNGIAFSGDIGMTAVRLDQFQGLADVLGAKLDGYAFANTSLSGSLPVGLPGDWQGNGDIEIQQGHWRESLPEHHIYLNRGADDQQAADVVFDTLSSRFRLSDSGLSLNRLMLKQGKQVRCGQARFNPQGEISGKLVIEGDDSKRESVMHGQWPSLRSFFSGP